MENGRKCPHCGSSRIEKDLQLLELACAECGLVLSEPDFVNTLPQNERDAQEQGGRGVGPAVKPQPFQKALGSSMNGLRDAQGRRLSQGARDRYGHLGWLMKREIHRGKLCPQENPEARDAIARIVAQLDLPPILREEAQTIFRESMIRGVLRGRSLPAITGACVYAACRKYDNPHALSEIAAAAGIKRWEVGRAFKALNRGLEKPVPPANLRTYFQRYAEELALSPAVRGTVEEMLDRAAEHPEASGLSPHGIVAALIYIASEQHGEKVSRVQMARVSSITEMTLRTTTKVMERLMGRPTRSQG